MIQVICGVADAVERLRGIGSLLRAALFGHATATRTPPGWPSQRTYLDLTIRREIAAADVAKARKAKKKAPFGKVRSLAHEMLKAEIGRG